MVNRVLVSGASIAGLAAAYWLHRAGWQVSVIERAREFRAGGQNVDVRGLAKDVIDRMGLLEGVQRRNTTEKGTRFVDREGAALAEFPQSGTDGPTAELEILRGDLADLLREALADDVEIAFDRVIADVAVDGGDVHVSFADGEEAAFDLLVVAEGVRSTTRDLVFVDEVGRKPLNLQMVYGRIPHGDADDGWWNWYTATKQRQVTTRPDPEGTTRATLAYIDHEDELRDRSKPEQLKLLALRFADAGWETQRILAGLTASDDVYTDYLTQIVMSQWSRGNVVAIGDAAWCITPLGGGGSSLALIGAYVLAAQLSRADSVADGLAAFEAWMRPVVEDAQKLPPGVPRLVYPKTDLGVATQNTFARIANLPPLRDLIARKIGAVADDTPPLPAMARREAEE